MPSLRAPLAVAAMAAVLALASAAGRALLAAGLVVVVLVFTTAATSSFRYGPRRWSTGLVAVVGLGALTWTYLDGTADLTQLGALLGPVLVLSIVLQLWRRDGRIVSTASLMTVVTVCALAALPAGWLALRASADGVYSVGLALLGIGSMGLAEALPLSRALRRVLGVLVCAMAAAVLVVTVDEVGEPVPAVGGVVVAAFAGLMAGVSLAVVDRLSDELAVVHAPSSAGLGVRGRRAAGSATAPAGGRSVAGLSTIRHSSGRSQQGLSAAWEWLRISLPFIGVAPVAYVLGRIFIA